jgi:hypothetical protein
VRDTSVAVSIARSAMLGGGTGCGVSTLTLDAFHALGDEAATFGYPCERSFLNSGPQATFGYPQQAPFGERRVTASMKNAGR